MTDDNNGLAIYKEIYRKDVNCIFAHNAKSKKSLGSFESCSLKLDAGSCFDHVVVPSSCCSHGLRWYHRQPYYGYSPSRGGSRGWPQDLKDITLEAAMASFESRYCLSDELIK